MEEMKTDDKYLQFEDECDIQAANIFIICVMSAIPFMGVFFIGTTGNSDALISCGLGAATVNIIFDAVDCGLMSGLDTLVSQAFGRRDIDACEAYLNICRYFVLLLVIPQAVVVHFSDAIFVFLGQPQATAADARYYLVLLFPGYVCMHLYILNRRYFNCLGKTKEVLLISAFTLVLHIVLLYAMVIRAKWGLTGVGVSSSLSLGVQLLISEVYTSLQTVREHRASWVMPDADIVSRIPTFMSYGVPGLLECFLAVFPLEVFPIFAGWIGPDEIAANIVLNNIYFILCHVPFSMSLTAAAFVGNNLGENKPNKTLTYVKANIVLTVLFAVVILLGIRVFQDVIGCSYTDSAAIVDIFKQALPLFLLFNFGDFVFYITEGILIGVGYQKILVFLIFLWMWAFMIPTAYVAINVYKRGFIDIWIIFCVARACLAVSNVVIIFVTDWKAVAQEISQDETDKD